MFDSKLRWGRWNSARSIVAPVAAVALIAASIISVGAVRPADQKNPAATAAHALSQAFRDAAKTVQPSVVLIKSEPATQVRFEGKAPSDDEQLPDGLGDLFRNNPNVRKFFKELPQQQPKHGQSGMGSGIIIDGSGLILTNNHVVSGGGEITVRLHDGREFKGTHIVTDPATDLALVRIEGAGQLTAAMLGDSDQVEVGDWVLALGHPFGLEDTVTAGIVSAKGRGIGINPRESFLQTDAAINPGNSGGPLVNLDGQVIGINTAISSSSGGSEGLGFAIPSNLAQWVVKQLSNGGVVHRARLGVLIQPMTAELAKQFGVKPHEGVLVGDVTADSPAAKAGVKAGDVIVEFAGKAVATPQELQMQVEEAPLGRDATVAIVRDGKRMGLKVKLTEAPSATVSSDNGKSDNAPSRLEKLGLEVQDLTPELAKQLEFKAEHGVVVTDVHAGSAAERAGLVTGMVIVEAAHKTVGSAAEFAKSFTDKSLSDGVLLLVRSAQGSRYVVLRG